MSHLSRYIDYAQNINAYVGTQEQMIVWNVSPAMNATTFYLTSLIGT